jgi:hypothetical protein
MSCQCNFWRKTCRNAGISWIDLWRVHFSQSILLLLDLLWTSTYFIFLKHFRMRDPSYVEMRCKVVNWTILKQRTCTVRGCRPHAPLARHVGWLPQTHLLVLIAFPFFIFYFFWSQISLNMCWNVKYWNNIFYNILYD